MEEDSWLVTPPEQKSRRCKAVPVASSDPATVRRVMIRKLTHYIVQFQHHYDHYLFSSRDQRDKPESVSANYQVV